MQFSLYFHKSKKKALNMFNNSLKYYNENNFILRYDHLEPPIINIIPTNEIFFKKIEYFFRHEN